MKTAEEIAQYFRESVSFDFSETITSFSQIEEKQDTFFVFLNRVAFKALIEDFLLESDERILSDLFVRSFGSDFGFNIFAEKHNRDMAEMIKLTTMTSHSQNDSVYIVTTINVWLKFFNPNAQLLVPEITEKDKSIINKCVSEIKKEGKGILPDKQNFDLGIEVYNKCLEADRRGVLEKLKLSKKDCEHLRDIEKTSSNFHRNKSDFETRKKNILNSNDYKPYANTKEVKDFLKRINDDIQLVQTQLDSIDKLQDIRTKVERVVLKRRRRSIAAISFVFFVLALATLYFGYGGIVTYAVRFEVYDNKATLTGHNDFPNYAALFGGEREVIDVPKTVRAPWSFGQIPVVAIGEDAFSFDDMIETVYIDSNIREIGSGAFSNCSNLKNVYINSNAIPSIGKNAFSNSSAVIVNVPLSKYSSYIQDVQWKSYSSLIFPVIDGESDGIIVLLDLNGGVAKKSLSLPTGLCGYTGFKSGAKVPNDIVERYGYVFGGWQTLGGKDFDSEVTTSVKLVAKWIPASAKITFDYQSATGGNSKEYKDVIYSKAVGELPSPVRAGYTFGGWFTGTRGGGKEYLLDTIFEKAEGITLYAYWILDYYIITFDYQGAGEDTTYVINYGNEISYYLPQPKKNGGYTFGGWWTGEGGTGEEFTANTPYEFTNDITLYAKWQSKILLDYQKGKQSGQPSNIQVVYNLVMTQLPTEVERNGFTFEGWWTAVGGGGKQIQNNTAFLEDGEITLYAKWKTTITFDAKGGTVSRYTQEVIYNKEIGELPEPTKASAVFVGWYLDEAYTTPVTKSKIFTENSPITLYARWAAVLVFNYEGGTGEALPEYIIVTDGALVGVLPSPAKIGHKFGGWFTQKNGEGTHYTTSTVFKGTSSVSLYAYWVIKQFQLSFDAGNGSVVLTAILANYGTEIPRSSLPQTSYYGYDFIDWSIMVNGKKVTLGKWTDGGTILVGDWAEWMDGNLHKPIQINSVAQWTKITATYYGSGVASDPFRIFAEYQLKDLAAQVNNGNSLEGKYFVLMNDIAGIGTMPAIGNNNNSDCYSTASAAVKRRFAGTFDGDNYTLSDYNIDSIGEDSYSGLFGYIAETGVVKNLKVSNISVDSKATGTSGSKGGAHSGGIAGVNSGKIDNCTVISGTVKARDSIDTHVGGIAGYIFMTGAVISNCKNSATISGNAMRCTSHGGIVGSVNNGIVYNSINYGGVTGSTNSSKTYSNGQTNYVFNGGIAGVSCAVIYKCENKYSTISSGNVPSHGAYGGGGIVGYIHNGSDSNTSATAELPINKTPGVSYYSAVIDCVSTGSNMIGFLQSDTAESSKKSVAITNGYTVGRVVVNGSTTTTSNSNVAKITNSAEFRSYVEQASVIKNIMIEGMIFVPIEFIINYEQDNAPAGNDNTKQFLAKEKSLFLLIAGVLLVAAPIGLLSYKIIKVRLGKKQALAGGDKESKVDKTE